ncbi:MAG: hypothetical protein ABEK84_10095 [Salinibacter sp.]
MNASWSLGIGLGILVIGLHASMRMLTHYLSFRTSDQYTFLFLELGGLGGRMMIVFGAVALVLLFVPVHAVAFVGTVLLLLVLSMVVETRLIARRTDRNALES